MLQYSMKLLAFLLPLLSILQVTGAKTITLPIVTQGPVTRCIEKSKSQPKLTVVSNQGKFICYQDDTQITDGAYISLTTAKYLVEALGGTVKPKSDKTWEVWFNKGYFLLWPNFNKGPESYIGIADFLSGITGFLNDTRSPKDTTIFTSFDNPRLHFNNTTIKLSRVGSYPLGKALYQNLIGHFIDALIYSNEAHNYENRFMSYYNGNPQTFKTHLGPDEAVMALSMLGKDIWSTELSRVDSQGHVTFHGPNTLRLVDSKQQLKPPQKGQPLPTLLIRMTHTPLQRTETGILRITFSRQ